MEAYFELLIGAFIALNMYTTISPDERTGPDQWTMTFSLLTIIPVLLFPLFVSWYTLYHVRWLTNLRRRDLMIVILDKLTLKVQAKPDDSLVNDLIPEQQD